MLTQQQIAQMLPFDWEIAKKHPEWVFHRNGHTRADYNDAVKDFENVKGLREIVEKDLRLFPHRKVELWLMLDTIIDRNIVLAAEYNYKEEMLAFEQITDLNQSVTVLIFDETLLNK